MPKKPRKKNIGLDVALKKALSNINKELDGPEKQMLMRALGIMGSKTVMMEMRASGVSGSRETGTHFKRSRSQREKANDEGSILDTSYKNVGFDDVDIVYVGHEKHKGAYRARFQDDGTDTHVLWGKSTLDPSPNNRPKGYMDNARKQIGVLAPAMIKTALVHILKKAKKVRVRGK
jgi:hypothetical protein